MLLHILNILGELFGFYKKGAVDKPDERDYDAVERLGSYEDKLPKEVDLLNTSPDNQGYTNKCTAYATSHAMRIMNIMEHKNKAIWFDPDLQWENQKEYPGTAEDALGDYVQSALKSAVRFGFEAGGRVYTADKYARCMKPKVKDMLAKGYPVVTGAYTANPMCDLDWNYIKPKSKGGGHAFVLVGYSDVEKCYYAFNSWGRWGIKGTGVFKIRYEDFSSIFSCYVLYDSKDDLKEN